MSSLDVLRVTVMRKKSVYHTASFQYHPHKAASLLCHADNGKSLVHADRL